MKTLALVALWLTLTFFIIAGSIWATAYDAKQKSEACEGRIANELNTTAIYIDGHCMVKGYGRFNGR